jgi:hypothetical protein
VARKVGVGLARVEAALRLLNDRIGRRRRAVTGFIAIVR